MTGKTLILGAGIVIAAVVLYAQRGAGRAAVTEPRAVTPAVRITGGANATPHVWTPSRSTPEEPPVAVGKRDAIAEPPPARDQGPAQPKRGETLIEQFAPLHDALESAFVLESHDGAWSMEAQRKAEASLSAILPPRAAVKSIDCRSTLCRIETTHDGYPDAKMFVSRLAAPERRPWNGAFYTGPIAREPGTGTVTFITYLGREGATMPAIPDPS
jgi:glycine/D-amino acid oxidase-like deaminating enzyme